ASDGKSPLLPKTGDEPLKKVDEKAAKRDKDDDKPAVKAVKIDLTGLQNRIIALPLAERNYDSLSVADDGALFYVERSQPGASNEPPGSNGQNNGTLYRYDFAEKKAEQVKDGL